MHLEYACAHSGACCSSGWPIPVERSRVVGIQTLRDDQSWLRPAPGAPADVGGVLALSDNGHCVFHHEGCEIHSTLGVGAKPAACQHFPREVLIDPRGVFVTLSHYCPTAADLLFEHTGPVEIVAGPPAVAFGEPEGLDARDVLPPLLVDGVLMDYEGYSAWEAHMVAVLTRDDGLAPEVAVETLKRDAIRLQRWKPAISTTLAEEIATLSRERYAEKENRPGRISFSYPAQEIHPERFFRGIPSSALSAVIKRYLAARAFASWMAYQGNGIAAVVGSLALTLSVLREHIARLTANDERALTAADLKEAIRATDRLLVHELPRGEVVHRAQASWRQMLNSTTTGP